MVGLDGPKLLDNGLDVGRANGEALINREYRPREAVGPRPRA